MKDMVVVRYCGRLWLFNSRSRQPFNTLTSVCALRILSIPYLRHLLIKDCQEIHGNASLDGHPVAILVLILVAIAVVSIVAMFDLTRKLLDRENKLLRGSNKH